MRLYSILIPGTASPATAAFDAFEIKGTSTKGLRLHEIVIAQSSDTDSEQIAVDVKRYAGSYTSGSGGSTPTAVALNSNSASPAVTAETMNTTQASAGTGSLTTILSDSFNVLSGWHYLPTPEARPCCAPSEGFVVSLGAHADALTITGYAIVEELP